MKRRIVAQRGRVVDVLVSGGDLIDALPKQIALRVTDLAAHPAVDEGLVETPRQPQPLVHRPEEQHSGIGSQRIAIEPRREHPSADGKEINLRVTLCHDAGTSCACDLWLRTPTEYKHFGVPASFLRSSFVNNPG